MKIKEINERRKIILEYVDDFVNDTSKVVNQFAKIFYDYVVKSVSEINKESLEIKNSYINRDGTFSSGFVVLQLKVPGNKENDFISWSEILEELEKKNSNIATYFSPLYKYVVSETDYKGNKFYKYSNQNTPFILNLLRTEVVKKGLFSKDYEGFYSISPSNFSSDFLVELNKIIAQDNLQASFAYFLYTHNRTEGLYFRNASPYPTELRYIPDFKSSQDEFKVKFLDKNTPPKAFEIETVVKFEYKKRPVTPIEEK
jgi:hypothetical protein